VSAARRFSQFARRDGLDTEIIEIIGTVQGIVFVSVFLPRDATLPERGYAIVGLCQSVCPSLRDV